MWQTYEPNEIILENQILYGLYLLMKIVTEEQGPKTKNVYNLYV